MHNTLKDLKNKMKTIKGMGWIECNHKNRGSAGLKLEKLLGINPENFEIPDYNGIEIKTKKTLSKEKITLFCATPDSYFFEIKRLYELYSYPDKRDKKYNILNANVNTYKKTHIKDNIYFKLKVEKKEKIVLLVVYKDNKIVDCCTSWSFDLLKEKLERKLNYLCFVDVDTRFSHNQLFIKYKNDNYYILKDFNTFIDLLDNGIISISIRINIFKNEYRNGQIHDHGTAFCIDKKNLNLLFDKL